MARKRTILIYYSHKETLGHTTRVAALADALAVWKAATGRNTA